MTRPLAAITVVGNDRPGIVAGISKVLFESGCNLEDVTSTILRGHFAMVLVVRAPEQGAEELDARLRRAGTELGVDVALKPIEDVDAAVHQPTHMVSVYGADQPGIVFKVTACVAACGYNITDLTSRVIGTDDEPVYALMLEVAAPGSARDDDLEENLKELTGKLGVEVSVHPIEPDVL